MMERPAARRMGESVIYGPMFRVENPGDGVGAVTGGKVDLKAWTERGVGSTREMQHKAQRRGSMRFESLPERSWIARGRKRRAGS